MSKKKKKLTKEEAELRLYGYMTIDEFVKAFTFGLKLNLHDSWPKNFSDDDLHHPEDLAANCLSFAEAVFNTITIFGVNGAKVFVEDDDEK